MKKDQEKEAKLACRRVFLRRINVYEFFSQEATQRHARWVAIGSVNENKVAKARQRRRRKAVQKRVSPFLTA
jgi:hypothetical protein